MSEETQGRVCAVSVRSDGDGNKSPGGQANAANFQNRIEARFLGSCLTSPLACVQNDNFLSGRIQSVPQVCSLTHKNTHNPAAQTQTGVHTGLWKNTRWTQGSEADAPISVLQKAISWVPEREQEKINAFGQEYISFSPGSIDINRSVEKGWDWQQHKGGYFHSNLNQAESPCRCSSSIHFSKEKKILLVLFISAAKKKNEIAVTTVGVIHFSKNVLTTVTHIEYTAETFL